MGEGDDWAGARTLPLGEQDEDTHAGDDRALGVRLRRALRSGHAPPRVGRFFIQGELGSGAMGSVFTGLDPELDRKVAVKLVHHDPTSARARLRLQREAQALAQLSHPNVVPVFEVGEHEGQLFVAMELVAGSNLAQWLAAQPRTWREIVAIFIQAGEGLAAAHAVGLVHRDFKPHNVLVGDDGRVRVVDFGLATDDGDPSSVSCTRPDSATHDSGALTRTGELLGTPAFMSPEQFSGGPVGPASDQFAFCIALYRALGDERPFAGESVADLANSVLRNVAAPLPPGPYPPALHPVLARGLRRASSQRFADMRTLLSTLRAILGEAPPRRPGLTLGLGIGLGAATLALAGTLGWMALRPSVGAVDASGAATTPAAAPAPAPAPPDGEPPDFAALSGPRGRAAADHYGEGCASFAAGRVRDATRNFADAGIAYAGAGGTPQDAARIQYARALAHRAAYERDGHANDLRVAYELLGRIERDETLPRADPTRVRATRAYTDLVGRPDLAAAGIDPALPTRFVVVLLDQGAEGTEVAVDGEVIGHQPCTFAVAVHDLHFVITRHPRYFDHSLMWVPGSPDAPTPQIEQSPLPAGQTRADLTPLPVPPSMSPPETLSRAEDWPP